MKSEQQQSNTAPTYVNHCSHLCGVTVKNTVSDFAKKRHPEEEEFTHQTDFLSFQISTKTKVERRFKEILSRAVEGYEHALLSQTELFWKLWHSWRKTKCCQASVGNKNPVQQKMKPSRLRVRHD